MRRARGLRVSSTRDICIFCATRQSDPVTTLSTTQRRHLNSSGRSPQSAEGVIYKDADPPAKPLSQAAQMRRLFEAAAAPPAQTSGGYMSPAQRVRATLLQQGPPQPMKPPDRRATDQIGGFGLNLDQGRNRSAPQFGRRDGYNDILSRPAPPAANRYKVNMDARPQVSTPAFTSAQLKKPVELPPRPIQIKLENQAPLPISKPTSPCPRREIDPAELEKLLQVSASTNRFQSLAKDRNVQPKCWHCGSTGHASLACPTKPTLREPQPPVQLPVGPKVMYQPIRHEQQTQRARESIADAADAWTRRTRGSLEIQPPSQQYQNMENEKRRSRFESNGPMEADRYEEPQRRKGRVVPRRRDQDEEDDEDRRPRVSKQERKRLKAESRKAALQAKDEPTPITLPEFISVANLASILRLRVEDFVQKLEELGFEDVQNDHILNAEHAGLIAQEYNFEPNFQIEGQDGDLYPAPAVEPEVYAELPVRPPVVTIMGHVDHGKTTILDYMRSTSVAATEFGGITQHIGAFSVPLANGKKITFLDTPGHAAFETMRARGANVTDIVVLVVAADDSVMPQTVEAIKHAQAAKVPIIVAINKIDKQQADPEAVKLDLGRHGIEIEDFGGDVQAICVSGKTGQGIPDLEEAISTLSEMLDHRADPKANVEGWVLEGTTKKSGKVATVLVRRGTLRQGTTLVAGTTWTKVRGLRNEAGVAVKEVGPGVAVEVDGWRDQPIAGDEVLQADDEQHATAVSELRVEKEEREQMARDMDAVNEARRLEAERRKIEEAAAEAEANGEEVPVEEKKAAGPELVSFIVKGDVSGSVEAVIDSISVLGNGDISTRVLRHGVGPPSEFDVTHAADAKGHIINFNTVVPGAVAKLAEAKGVKILDLNIIYRVVESVRDILTEKLKPNVVQKVLGEAEVAAVFDIGLGGRKKMKVAGSKVRNGLVNKSSKVRVYRGEEVVHDGVINSIKNHKKEVDQMRKDTECGIAFEGWEDFQIGDRIQCYEEKFEKRTL